MATFGLVLATLIGACAWLYQRAWERHERLLGQYQEIIDRMQAFTVGGYDPKEIDAALKAAQRLWLIGPDSVVRAWNDFLATIETNSGVRPDDEKELRLSELILAMRNDVSFATALIPNFRRSKLRPDEIKLKSATRR